MGTQKSRLNETVILTTIMFYFHLEACIRILLILPLLIWKIVFDALGSTVDFKLLTEANVICPDSEKKAN